jgi:hypothetical protein
LENITEALFANNRLLSDLDLRNNRIKSLSSAAFQNLPNLQSLYLSNNFLKLLPQSLFSGTPKLEVIELQDNKLNAIDKTTFNNLKNLRYVWLNNNVCTNTYFIAPINSTFIAIALAKCDGNYHFKDSSFIGQLQTVATILANASSILASLTRIL